MKTMNAVVFFGKGDVRYNEVDVPACSEVEMRVRVEACAVCGSDQKTFLNGNPRMKPPITMGHEFTGLIETVGRSVHGFHAGERVVMATSISCGTCYYCKRGWSNLCTSLNPMGFSYPGGMADFVIIPELAIRNGHVVKVPKTIAAEYAALAEPVSCAVNCAETVNISKGDTVVIVGAGPLGIMNLYVAREFGARKIVLVQRGGKRFENAKGFAYDRLVNCTQESALDIVRKETDGVGADSAIVTAPDASAQVEALDLVRKRGCVCLFASLPLGKNILNLDSRRIHYGELRIVGVSDSTSAHVRKAISILTGKDFPRERLAHPILPMEKIDEAFRIMEAREGMRVVLKPSSFINEHN
jgi:L-iditol 2-dehydrogenase